MRQPVDHLPAGRFFGHSERLVKEQGFTLSEVRYTPGQKVPPHGHRLAYFCLLVDGGYWEQYGRRRVDYAPQSIVFHPPGDEHYGDISPLGGRCFNIETGSRWIDRLSQYGKVPRQPVVFEGGELTWLAIRLYREFRHRQAGLPLLIEGLGLEMLGALLQRREKRERRMPGWLRQVADRLRDEMGQPLRLESIAADLNVSPVRLSRSFRLLRRVAGRIPAPHPHRRGLPPPARSRDSPGGRSAGNRICRPEPLEPSLQAVHGNDSRPISEACIRKVVRCQLSA